MTPDVGRREFDPRIEHHVGLIVLASRGADLARFEHAELDPLALNSTAVNSPCFQIDLSQGFDQCKAH